MLDEYYDREKVKLIELGMGHEVSGRAEDVAVVVEAVRGVWGVWGVVKGVDDVNLSRLS